ncbi:hypothetical protein AB6D11_18555 [Vibrio splendidus]
MRTQDSTPTPSQNNQQFLQAISKEAQDEILAAIAKHYGTDASTILNEVTSEEAEHLLEYMTEPLRSSTYIMMQQHGLAPF